MISLPFSRLVLLAAILAGVLLFAATSAAERGEGAAIPACTQGTSSIGPIVIRDGRVVGGDPTPHTESCVP